MRVRRSRGRDLGEPRELCLHLRRGGRRIRKAEHVDPGDGEDIEEDEHHHQVDPERPHGSQHGMDYETHLAAVLEEQHHPEYADNTERRGGRGVRHKALRDEAGEHDHNVEDVPAVAEVVLKGDSREIPDEDLGGVDGEADIVESAEDAVPREIGLDSDGNAVEQDDCHYEVLEPRVSDDAPAGGCCCIHVVPFKVKSCGQTCQARGSSARRGGFPA